MLLNPEDFDRYANNFDELSIIMLVRYIYIVCVIYIYFNLTPKYRYLVMCYCQFKLKEKKNDEMRKKAIISVSEDGKKVALRAFFEGKKGEGRRKGEREEKKREKGIICHLY